MNTGGQLASDLLADYIHINLTDKWPILSHGLVLHACIKNDLGQNTNNQWARPSPANMIKKTTLGCRFFSDYPVPKSAYELSKWPFGFSYISLFRKFLRNVSENLM